MTRLAHTDAPAGDAVASSPDDFRVVAIGASAGGLDAFRKVLDGLPADSGMAFILVQHLDPTHPSLMVELLAGHTPMPVRHAAQGMPIEPDCVYAISPGTYLSVQDGALRLSRPRERHGARLPFDFLLHSLAAELGERAVCVVLSGTGADGSSGLKAVKEAGGLVIAQDPDEAGFSGMPQSAIMTGMVDLVLPTVEMPQALVNYQRRIALAREQHDAVPGDAAPDWLPEIVALLHSRTSHNFALYKPGTLRRRIERRMAMAAIDSDDLSKYLEFIRREPGQLDLLAKDLLINVTRFFRDRKVFDFLAANILPDLIHNRSIENALRIWVVGCSTGEEAYSLAMLAHEEIASAKHDLKLQIFASDVDPDAVASAREGLYLETIEADVSPGRLARFFVKEEQGYRMKPELRASVVFTVQDVLADPPFANLDMISCRNLLIYLQPEAQAKVLSLFDFALRKGGLLLLGDSESVGGAGDRFETVSEPERLYRHIGHGRPGGLGLLANAGATGGATARPGKGQGPPRQSALAELCQRLVLENHAPAAVLIDRDHECLYSLGPTNRYLRVVPERPTNDVLALAHEGVRAKLRAAIQKASQQNECVVVEGGLTGGNGGRLSFKIDVRPVRSEGRELLLVCFVEEPERKRKRGRPLALQELSRVAEIQLELDATKAELEDAIRDLEHSTDAQKAISEETLSVKEEFQATNEELLTSKEELQALNEELNALNSQLQETLVRQRTISNDLQNVLYSTDVATLFLDPNLNIRFFTPAIKSLFHAIPGDVGRPLADLSSYAIDRALPTDAQAVLHTFKPIEREIETESGAWYLRRTVPYRTQENEVEGVVVTYTDVTERKRVADVVEAAKRQAELANAAKSRFLAAASHDLRQPLQTLSLLQGHLEKTVGGVQAQQLVARLGEISNVMSGMLNALLDIDRIESGTVEVEAVDFPVGELLAQLREEFIELAQGMGLELRLVPCGQAVHSDPRLLGQMLRNLLSNALKYTARGRILLGCRRRPDSLRIEVWDTGRGIPEAELETIFEEYYQIDNVARERSRGYGLGLSIVQSLGNLLGHRIIARSLPGKGSVFAIEVALAQGEAAPQRGPGRAGAGDETAWAAYRSGAILAVEDDPGVRELLELVLGHEGHHVVVAPDGNAALSLMAAGVVRPDLIVADYSLPGGMNGLEFAAKAWERLNQRIPVIVLTADISPHTLRDIARQGCELLSKPIRLADLLLAVKRLLLPTPVPASAGPSSPRAAEDVPTSPAVYVIDDDAQVLEELRGAIADGGLEVKVYATAEAFLEAYRPGREACVLIDAYLPGMSGLALLQRLKDAGSPLTAIMITGYSDVQMAIQAMKAGATDFIEKPIERGQLLASIGRALERSADAAKLFAWREDAARRLAALTPRQRQIMRLILAGHPNKNIAADLGISQRTIENHRAAIMKRTGSKSLPALARLALAAAGTDADASLSSPGGASSRT